jgi:hypothetical protein
MSARIVRREAPGLLIRRPHPGPVLVAPPDGDLQWPDVRSAAQARAQLRSRAGAPAVAGAPGIHSAGWIRHDAGCEASLHSSSPGA